MIKGRFDAVSAIQDQSVERATLPPIRALADQAFSRAAGAPLINGNYVQLLKNAQENYPAWLAAIGRAQHHVYFESYIIHEDDAGRQFAEALIAKSREGVPVRLIYDWMGGFGKTSRRFWNGLRAAGIDVRCYNPPRLDSPLGWVSRDHRKMLAVDGQVGFITGLCVGKMWVGDPEKKIDPWRDTGIEVQGPAVVAIEQAFAEVWAMLGSGLPPTELLSQDALSLASNVSLRVVATLPATAGLFRVDQLVAALAKKRLWLTDAYYAGTTAYVQGLKAAAADSVDVRLLLPNATDIPLLRPLSRAGYRPLLEAGVRVFEWNGTMLHAKTAVADGRWARVGSSNLNVASWLGNCELDAVIEDEPFAQEMEAMYLKDLENATEIVLDDQQRARAPGEPRHPRPKMTSSGGGSIGRAGAGAIRLTNTIGAAFTNRRVMGPVEAQVMTLSGVLLLGLAALFFFFPKALVYPAIVMLAWMALALFYKGYRLHHRRKQNSRTSR
jgi:cardiolipin synthase A/B